MTVHCASALCASASRANSSASAEPGGSGETKRLPGAMRGSCMARATAISCADHRGFTAGTPATQNRDSRIAAMSTIKPAHPPRLYALVPCAGVGVRACTQGPKQYVQLAGHAMVGHTLAALQRVTRLQAVLVMLAPDDTAFEREVPEVAGTRAWIVRNGGDTRARTVANGLDALREHGADETDWVLVHDAARALVRPEWVERLIDACLDDDVGGLLALPVADTLKAESGGRAQATIDRRDKWV